MKDSREGQRAENVINVDLSVPLTGCGCLERRLRVGEERFCRNSAH